MGFNVTENEKFIDVISDSTLQLAFKKLLLVEFQCCVSNKKSYNYLENLTKNTPPFSNYVSVYS